jgi:hypothetical protein
MSQHSLISDMGVMCQLVTIDPATAGASRRAMLLLDEPKEWRFSRTGQPAARESDTVAKVLRSLSAVLRQAKMGFGAALGPEHFRQGDLKESAGVCAGRGEQRGIPCAASITSLSSA